MISLQRFEKRVHIKKAIVDRRNSTAIQADLDYPEDRLFDPSLDKSLNIKQLATITTAYS